MSIENAVKKGRCRLWKNDHGISEIEDFLIFGANGQDLCFPSLIKRDRVDLGIDWGDDPHVEYATVELESNKGIHTEIWKTAQAEWFFLQRPVSEQAGYYRELPLYEVCASFPYNDFLEEVKTKFLKLP